MNDYLQNSTLRTLLKTLNIPVPVPPILKRNLQPFSNDELKAKKIAVAGIETAFLHTLQKNFMQNRITQPSMMNASMAWSLVV